MLAVIKQLEDANRSKVETYQTIIEDLMDDGTMTWAGKFLVSIYDYMWYNHNITDGQIQAVKTIERRKHVRI